MPTFKQSETKIKTKTIKMKIGILGTGIVGVTIGSALISKGHEVKLGGRNKQNEKDE
jgi:predicted dinucleotide-binding enzyme